MMLRDEVNKYIDNIDEKIEVMDEAIRAGIDDRIHPVFSKYVVFAGSGLIENSISATLNEYCGSHSNQQIQKFISKYIKWQNSFNCNKIKELLNRFDRHWWQEIEDKTTKEERISIDSLKNLRDTLAHGGRNGTRYHVVIQYYRDAKNFVDVVEKVINPVV